MPRLIDQRIKLFKGIKMKKTLIALSLTLASTSSFANDMFSFDGAKKSVNGGYASVEDLSGVTFGGHIDLTSGLYFDASYFTVSGDETFFGTSVDLELSQLVVVAGMQFPVSDDKYWLAELGLARVSSEVGNFEVTESELAYKLGYGWDFGNKLSAEAYLADEGGDSFIGAIANYEVNEQFDVSFEYKLYDDAHMFITGSYKF